MPDSDRRSACDAGGPLPREAIVRTTDVPRPLPLRRRNPYRHWSPAAQPFPREPAAPSCWGFLRTCCASTDPNHRYSAFLLRELPYKICRSLFSILFPARVSESDLPSLIASSTIPPKLGMNPPSRLSRMVSASFRDSPAPINGSWNLLTITETPVLPATLAAIASARRREWRRPGTVKPVTTKIRSEPQITLSVQGYQFPGRSMIR